MVVWKMQPSFSSSRRRAAALVGEGELYAVSHAYEQRLGVAQLRLARGGIAHVAYGRFAGEVFQILFPENVGNEAHAHMQMAGAFPFIP